MAIRLRSRTWTAAVTSFLIVIVIVSGWAWFIRGSVGVNAVAASATRWSGGAVRQQAGEDFRATPAAGGPTWVTVGTSDPEAHYNFARPISQIREMAEAVSRRHGVRVIRVADENGPRFHDPWLEGEAPLSDPAVTVAAMNLDHWRVEGEIAMFPSLDAIVNLEYLVSGVLHDLAVQPEDGDGVNVMNAASRSSIVRLLGPNFVPQQIVFFHDRWDWKIRSSMKKHVAMPMSQVSPAALHDKAAFAPVASRLHSINGYPVEGRFQAAVRCADGVVRNLTVECMLLSDRTHWILRQVAVTTTDLQVAMSGDPRERRSVKLWTVEPPIYVTSRAVGDLAVGDLKVAGP